MGEGGIYKPLYLIGLIGAAAFLTLFSNTGTIITTPNGSFRLSALLPYALAALAIRVASVLSGRQSDARILRFISWLPPAAFFVVRPGVLTPQSLVVVGLLLFLDVAVSRPGLDSGGASWRPTKKVVAGALAFMVAGYAATLFIPNGPILTRAIIFLTLLGASAVTWLSERDNLTKTAAMLYLFAVLFFTLFLANSIPYGPLLEWGLLIMGFVSALRPALAGTRAKTPPLLPYEARTHAQRLEVKSDRERALSDALIQSYIQRGNFAVEISDRVAISMGRLGRGDEGERLKGLILAEARRGKKRRAHLMSEITRIVGGGVKAGAM